MFNKNDAHLTQESITLKDDSDNTKGILYLEYQVNYYDDIRLSGNQTATAPSSQTFLLSCKKRIIVYNNDSDSLTLEKEDYKYENYPAIINTTMSILTTDDQGKDIGVPKQLIDYEPKTVNTVVNQSGSNAVSKGSTDSTSNSKTVGSSFSETNSFSVSVSGSASGIGGSTSASHSSTSTHSKSDTSGTSRSESTNDQMSNSESMSIKDWGVYGYVNPINSLPYWTFGQEVPWNAVKSKKTDGTKNSSNTNQLKVCISDGMKSDLYNNDILYPPSELSQFGVNFVTKASWLLTIDNDASDEIKISHVINLYEASHYLEEKTPVVYRDSKSTSLNDKEISKSIDLNLMALDPIKTSKLAAIIGFAPNKFIRKPSSSKSFKIISSNNELLALDGTTYPEGTSAGFTATQTSLNINFDDKCKSLIMNLYFKVTDVETEYKLYFKHWKIENDIKLSFYVNNDMENPITKYVDSREGEGGGNNLLSISLRNLDYESIEYHDLLKLGLNTVQVKIEPENKSKASNSGYQIRAISIE